MSLSSKTIRRTYPLTRTAALLTAAYNVSAVARPQSLVSGLDGQVSLDEATLLTRTWAGRDLPVTAVALADQRALPAAVALRIVADLTDATVLGLRCTGTARRKALGVTLGWAAVNAVCYLTDRRLRA